MVERAIQSQEVESLPRNPHQELCEILGVDDSTPWTSVSKKYSTDEVDISLSARNHYGVTKKASICVELYHEFSIHVPKGEKSRSGVYHINSNGTVEGMVYNEIVPGVGYEILHSPRNGQQMRKRREQAAAVVDFVKSKILPEPNPNT